MESTYEQRAKDYSDKINNLSGTFVERMESIDDYGLKILVCADLATLTWSAEWTVRNNWCKGKIVPSMVKQVIIANYFGCTTNELFPKEEKEQCKTA